MTKTPITVGIPTATKTYRVADHCFAVTLPSAALTANERLMAAYRPFETEAQEPLFRLAVHEVEAVDLPDAFTEDTRQSEDGQTIVSGNMTDGHKAIAYHWGSETAFMESTADYRSATLYVTAHRLQHAIDNTLMLLYAFTTATRATLLFHASAVVWQDRAFLFLGVSGTGKSTHSRLWLETIGGTWLLNDDNPVVRISDEGVPVVYGSPWSGKTPCYKNEHYPLGALVRLHQAPSNHIRPASLMEAYVAVTESVSGKRWENAIADGLHASTEALLKGCRVFMLHCLPDTAAARVCWHCVTGQERGGVS